MYNVAYKLQPYGAIESRLLLLLLWSWSNCHHINIFFNVIICIS